VVKLKVITLPFQQVSIRVSASWSLWTQWPHYATFRSVINLWYVCVFYPALSKGWKPSISKQK